MCIEISQFNTPRISRKSLHAFRESDTTYRIEPWGQSASQLPAILLKPLKQRKSVLEFKNKISNTDSVCKENKQIKYNSVPREKSIVSFSYAKKKINSKYDPNSYKQKSIKIIGFLKEQQKSKTKLKKKFSKKLYKNKNKNLFQQQHSKIFQSIHSSSLSKIEKLLEIQRKIFLISKDKS